MPKKSQKESEPVEQKEETVVDPEDLLSPELKDELSGFDQNSESLLIATKKKKKVLTPDELRTKQLLQDQEVVKEAKKLSKKAQKKVDQIKVRKMRESKRSEYLEVLHTHQLSSSQQQLLTSSKMIGQSLTTRQSLSLLLKKERAGFQLTEDERASLYSEDVDRSDEYNSDAEDRIYHSFANKTEDNAHSQPMAIEVAPVEVQDAAGDVLFDVNDLFTTTATTNKKQKKNKKKRKASDTDVDTEEANDVATEEEAAKVELSDERVELTDDQFFELIAKLRPDVMKTLNSNLRAEGLEIPDGNDSEHNREEVNNDESTMDTVTDHINNAEEKTTYSVGIRKTVGTTGRNVKRKKLRQQVSTIPLINDHNNTNIDEDNDNNNDVTMEVDEMDEPVVEVPKEEPKKKSKKIVNANSDTTDSTNAYDPIVAAKPVTTKSVGKNLLSQLKQLKKKIINEEHPSKAIESTTYDHDDTTTIATPYTINEVTLPVDDIGRVVPTTTNEQSKSTSKVKSSGYSKKAIFVPRPAAVTENRMQLPVCQMEQEIVEAVLEQDVVIVCGETGSGKSTQIPQFLYEAGFTQGEYGGQLIGITQPRRVAVVSTSERVNYEMGETNQINNTSNHDGRLVGYQVRYDASTIGSKTQIKFMTDGILLREITQDLLLRKYSVILIDEAHERNVNTDVLLGLLSRAVPLRRQLAEAEQRRYQSLSESERQTFHKPMQPLKVIIMSATLRVSDFQADHLFQPIPPVLTVEARQFPVVSHFARRTEMKNYLKEVHRKVCQIHRKLPAGGVLIFLTGKREILYMCQKLQHSLDRDYQRHIQRDNIKKKNSNKKKAIATPSDVFDEYIADSQETISTTDKTTTNTSLPTIFNEEGDEEDFPTKSRTIQLSDGQEDIDSDIDQDDDSTHSDGEEDDNDDNEQQVKGELDSDDEYYAKKEQASRQVTSKAIDESAALRKQMLSQVLNLGQVITVDPTASTSTIVNSNGTVPADTTAEMDMSPPSEYLKPIILPLYAMMPAHLQARVFAAVPPGHRLIVVATNVAETSITIPDIKYVVDCGRYKAKVMSSSSANNDSDATTSVNGAAAAGIAKYEIRWVSQASADQRQGRAGRTGPGHCYRLYSSAFFHSHMPTFQPPEIATTPLEDLLLQMKSLGIQQVESFPFPSPPPMVAWKNALSLLENLGALVTLVTTSSANKTVISFELSEVGKQMARYPINVRYAKMLVVACESIKLQLRLIDNKESSSSFEGLFRLLAFTLTLVATFAEKSPFILDEQGSLVKPASAGVDDEDDDFNMNKDQNISSKKQSGSVLFKHDAGDALAALRAVGAFVYTVEHTLTRDETITSDVRDMSNMEKYRFASALPAVITFSESHGLHLPTLLRILDLRSQIQSLCLQNFQSLSTVIDIADIARLNSLLQPPSTPPTKSEETSLQQILLAGYCDCLAKKVPPTYFDSTKHNSKHNKFTNSAAGAALAASTSDSGNLTRRRRLTAYLSCHPSIQQPIYLHPQSTLYRADPAEPLPEYIVYNSLLTNTKGDCLYMTNNTTVEVHWISAIARDCRLLRWNGPLESPSPYFDAESDKLFCYALARYGRMQWNLPAVTKPMEEVLQLVTASSQNNDQNSANSNHHRGDEIYRWFLRLLLENKLGFHQVLGNVLNADRMQISPALITQNHMHPKVSALVRACIQNQVCSRSRLLEKMRQTQGTFLLEQLLAFVKTIHRSEFREHWKELAKFNVDL